MGWGFVQTLAADASAQQLCANNWWARLEEAV